MTVYNSEILSDGYTTDIRWLISNSIYSRSRSNDRESEYLKVYWKPLKEDSRNFEAWTRLLQYVEQLVSFFSLLESFTGFCMQIASSSCHCTLYLESSWSIRKIIKEWLLQWYIDCCREYVIKQLIIVVDTFAVWKKCMNFTKKK